KFVSAFRSFSKRILSLFKKDYNYYLTKPELGVVYYPLNEQLLAKWQSAIDKQIPVFLFGNYTCSKGCDVYIELNSEEELKFKLPTYPKNIKELQIIRFWFEQLFRCSFQSASFFYKIFNPEMIKLLFENNNKNINFYIQQLYSIYPSNSIYKSQFEFIIDHLIITQEIKLNFYSMDNIDEQNNYLLKLLFNCGKRINCICCVKIKEIQKLIGLIVNNIKMSTDCSKIVSKFEFSFFYSQMEIKADRIEISENDEKIAICEYKNIYNPSIKYLAKYYFPFFEEDDDEIRRIVFERI
ncbi:F-box domain-containing protein, partial [Meloidogyne graminicola]